VVASSRLASALSRAPSASCATVQTPADGEHGGPVVVAELELRQRVPGAVGEEIDRVCLG